MIGGGFETHSHALIDEAGLTLAGLQLQQSCPHPLNACARATRAGPTPPGLHLAETSHPASRHAHASSFGTTDGAAASVDMELLLSLFGLVGPVSVGLPAPAPLPARLGSAPAGQTTSERASVSGDEKPRTEFTERTVPSNPPAVVTPHDSSPDPQHASAPGIQTQPDPGVAPQAPPRGVPTSSPKSHAPEPIAPARVHDASSRLSQSSSQSPPPIASPVSAQPAAANVPETASQPDGPHARAPGTGSVSPPPSSPVADAPEPATSTQSLQPREPIVRPHVQTPAETIAIAFAKATPPLHSAAVAMPQDSSAIPRIEKVDVGVDTHLLARSPIATGAPISAPSPQLPAPRSNDSSAPVQDPSLRPQSLPARPLMALPVVAQAPGSGTSQSTAAPLPSHPSSAVIQQNSSPPTQPRKVAAGVDEQVFVQSPTATIARRDFSIPLRVQAPTLTTALRSTKPAQVQAVTVPQTTSPTYGSHARSASVQPVSLPAPPLTVLPAFAQTPLVGASQPAAAPLPTVTTALGFAKVPETASPSIGSRARVQDASVRPQALPARPLTVQPVISQAPGSAPKHSPSQLPAPRRDGRPGRAQNLGPHALRAPSAVSIPLREQAPRATTAFETVNVPETASPANGMRAQVQDVGAQPQPLRAPPLTVVPAFAQAPVVGASQHRVAPLPSHPASVVTLRNSPPPTQPQKIAAGVAAQGLVQSPKAAGAPGLTPSPKVPVVLAQAREPAPRRDDRPVRAQDLSYRPPRAPRPLLTLSPVSMPLRVQVPTVTTAFGFAKSTHVEVKVPETTSPSIGSRARVKDASVLPQSLPARPLTVLPAFAQTPVVGTLQSTATPLPSHPTSVVIQQNSLPSTEPHKVAAGVDAQVIVRSPAATSTPGFTPSPQVQVVLAQVREPALQADLEPSAPDSAPLMTTHADPAHSLSQLSAPQRDGHPARAQDLSVRPQEPPAPLFAPRPVSVPLRVQDASVPPQSLPAPPRAVLPAFAQAPVVGASQHTSAPPPSHTTSVVIPQSPSPLTQTQKIAAGADTQVHAQPPIATIAPGSVASPQAVPVQAQEPAVEAQLAPSAPNSATPVTTHANPTLFLTQSPAPRRDDRPVRAWDLATQVPRSPAPALASSTVSVPRLLVQPPSGTVARGFAKAQELQPRNGAEPASELHGPRARDQDAGPAPAPAPPPPLQSPARGATPVSTQAPVVVAAQPATEMRASGPSIVTIVPGSPPQPQAQQASVSGDTQLRAQSPMPISAPGFAPPPLAPSAVKSVSPVTTRGDSTHSLSLSQLEAPPVADSPVSAHAPAAAISRPLPDVPHSQKAAVTIAPAPSPRPHAQTTVVSDNTPVLPKTSTVVSAFDFVPVARIQAERSTEPPFEARPEPELAKGGPPVSIHSDAAGSSSQLPASHREGPPARVQDVRVQTSQSPKLPRAAIASTSKPQLPARSPATSPVSVRAPVGQSQAIVSVKTLAPQSLQPIRTVAVDIGAPTLALPPLPPLPPISVRVSELEPTVRQSNEAVSAEPASSAGLATVHVQRASVEPAASSIQRVFAPHVATHESQTPPPVRQSGGAPSRDDALHVDAQMRPAPVASGSRHFGHDKSGSDRDHSGAAIDVSFPAALTPPGSSPDTTQAPTEPERRAFERVEHAVQQFFIGEVPGGGQQVQLVLNDEFFPGVTIYVQQAAGQVQVTFECTVRASRQELSRLAPAFARTLAQRLGRDTVVRVQSARSTDSPDDEDFGEDAV